jgi:hypothetical protein
LPWVFLTVILGDVDWFESLHVVAGDNAVGEGWETIAVIDVTRIVAAFLASCLDYITRVVALVDLLP